MLEKDTNILKRVIMGDETWTSHYDTPLKQETSTHNFPREVGKKKVCQQHSSLKIMLSAFFKYQGTVYQTGLPANQTINSEYYQFVLRKLRYYISRKRPHLCDNWILHHDNARSQGGYTLCVICMSDACDSRIKVRIANYQQTRLYTLFAIRSFLVNKFSVHFQKV